MTTYNRQITFLILFFSSVILQGKSLNSRINSLNTFDANVVTDSVSKICWDICQLEPEKAKRLTTLLVKTTKLINTESYLTALGFSLNYVEKGKLALLNSIYEQAKKENLFRFMAWTFETKSKYYKFIEKYDSSMTAILAARDLYERYGFVDDLVSVTHTIGDLYFTAELFDDAEKMYKIVQELKGESIRWKYWRKRVIRNNLALIEKRRCNYKSASNLFTESLNELFENHSNGVIDSIAASYIYSELAKISFLSEDYKSALQYTELGLKPAIDYNRYEFLANIYLTKSKIAFVKEKPDSALYFAKLSEKLCNEKFNSLQFKTSLTSFIIKVYEKLNDRKYQLFYYQKSSLLKDSLMQKLKDQKYLQLLAKSEYEKLNINYQAKQRESTILFSAGVFLFALFIIVLILNFRLRKSNLNLVHKSIELQESTKHLPEEITVSDNKEIDKNDGESEKLKELIKQFEKLVSKEKLFLENDLSIQKVSELLKTNRTYLSKAINGVLNVPFTTYINSLRIKETISIIRSDSSKNYTIEAIANNCGFNSRSAFIRTFKVHTGVTPSFFIKNYKTMTDRI